MALLLPGPGAGVSEPRHNLQAVCQQQQQAGPGWAHHRHLSCSSEGINCKYPTLAPSRGLQCHNMPSEFG